MGKHFTSGLLAGIVAAVIWMAAGMMVALQASAIGLGALVFLVGVCLITMIVAAAIARSRGAQGAEPRS
ncbi:hypothetical protein [Nigerium massiliense]|uniref:hypothetical protein n=1 Tax=Nigerium massiliense TaxID=1522317 RepID=UPI000590F5C9|nr:hypothetical protein [Nigerium massiliense]